MAVKAITFDFWFTLFRDANQQERRRLRLDAFTAATGATPEAVSLAFDRAAEEFREAHLTHHATLHPEDYVRITCREIGATLDPATVKELTTICANAVLKEPPLPIEGALEAVKDAAAHVPVGLISDTGLSPGSCLRQLLDRHGFLPYFRTLVFSGDMGVAKPHQRMFHTAAQAMGVRAGELLHIGDLEPTDIAGVHNVGGMAALFTGENEKYKTSTTADHIFPNWNVFRDALPGILNGKAKP